MVVSNLSDTFSALSDPTRLLILERLAARGQATVNELAEPFDMTQQAISKHLAYLERANLIVKRREGRQQICTLVPDSIRKVAFWAVGYERYWKESHERLDALLEELKREEAKKGKKS
jgi:DNA-binding transcriptional ArsR family regulator